MIVGLLNLYGTPALQQLVIQALTTSGLIAATDILYYSHVPITHPRSARVNEERDLFRCAKQYTGAYVWSFNVKDFGKGTPSDLDWCAYELYFLVEHWRRAITTLESGYDSYGVNLHSVPEPHYEGYCFWMKGSSMNGEALTHPYCAFQSFTNHYSQRFPASEYQDCDWSQSAPLSSRRLQERLFQLPEEQRSLATLMLLLVYSKNHFEPIAYHTPIRPSIIIDGSEIGALAAGAPGIGRIDCVLNKDTTPLISHWSSLGWRTDFNACEQIDHRQVDIIYTTSDRVEQWIPHLAGQGVIVIRGRYYGRFPSSIVGDFTLVAVDQRAFALH